MSKKTQSWLWEGACLLGNLMASIYISKFSKKVSRPKILSPEVASAQLQRWL